MLYVKLKRITCFLQCSTAAESASTSANTGYWSMIPLKWGSVLQPYGRLRWWLSSACRERLRANPSLVNCCTIDWFGSWPEDALEAVALKQLKDIDLDTATRNTLVGLCQAMHVKVQESCLRRCLHAIVHQKPNRCDMSSMLCF